MEYSGRSNPCCHGGFSEIFGVRDCWEDENEREPPHPSPFPEIKKGGQGGARWSPGFFSSTVGIKENVIKRYVEYQEPVDKGQFQLKFDF